MDVCMMVVPSACMRVWDLLMDARQVEEDLLIVALLIAWVRVRMRVEGGG